MLSAGSCCRICARLSDVKPLDLPFIHTSTLLFPLSDTLPSLSTSTEGMLSSTSLAASPLFEMSCVTSNDLRSTSSFIVDFCPVMVTPASSFLFSDIYMRVNVFLGESAVSSKSRVSSLYPTNVRVST